MNRLKSFDPSFLSQLTQDARTSPRKRAHYNLHHDFSEPVNRMFIALDMGTYVRPHWHPEANKWELMMVVKGSLALLIFDEQGEIISRLILGPNGESAGVEIPAGYWHSLVCLEPETVILEVKEGPFIPSQASQFADWAPEEGSAGVRDFLHWAKNAVVGETFSEHFDLV